MNVVLFQSVADVILFVLGRLFLKMQASTVSPVTNTTITSNTTAITKSKEQILIQSKNIICVWAPNCSVVLNQTSVKHILVSKVLFFCRHHDSALS